MGYVPKLDVAKDKIGFVLGASPKKAGMPSRRIVTKSFMSLPSKILLQNWMVAPMTKDTICGSVDQFFYSQNFSHMLINCPIKPTKQANGTER